jgi:radical SAM superfamily enzyme YgiQ (UPF0313 family)
MEQTEKPKNYKNLGTNPLPELREADFPTADVIVREGASSQQRSADAVDIMLVNPPAPDGGIWIRSQHRVGRRSRENMVWPQVSLAQMAAILQDQYTVKVVDCIGSKINWKQFTALLNQYQPRYYLTQVTAPTLENDMYGTFLAKNRGATTMAYGTHVTPIPIETMKGFSTLDYVLYGEPDLTIRDLLDHLEGKLDQRSPEIQRIFDKQNGYSPAIVDGRVDLHGVRGIVWRDDKRIVKNAARPFIADLDDLPIPAHELLPLQSYKMPMIKGPFTFIVTERGCPAGCTFCIKHVSYQNTVRLRSAEKIVEELWVLNKLDIHNIHMYADLFTVSREQVMTLCQLILDQGLKVHWTCNSRVDYIDEEMLEMMAKAGCWFISWGIESGNPEILKHAHKGITLDRVRHSLALSHKAGIKNWGYFIIGLPGETEETIRHTIDFAKQLPLDIALFHIAAPHPGTPLFFEVVENGWIRKGTRWEQVDMDKETVLDYPQLSPDRLMYWQKRAWREWALRPGPAFTYLKMLVSDPSTFMNALSVGFQHLIWQIGRSEKK